MIVRNEPDGSLLTISQTDHSRFVGLLAAHWGNEDILAPEPYESVVRAAIYHDFAYLDWEPVPEVDPESGSPYEFRRMPFDPRQLDAYQKLIDWLSSLDAYAGLLVNMHRTGLWRSRYHVMAQPAPGPARSVTPAIDDFITRNEARQSIERQAFDGPLVETNYRLLQIWDLLGLYFGCQDPVTYCIGPVPTPSSLSGSGELMQLEPIDKQRVRFDPFPFDQRPMNAHMIVRRLDRQHFADTQDFRRAYFSAVPETLDYELI